MSWRSLMVVLAFGLGCGDDVTEMDAWPDAATDAGVSTPDVPRVDAGANEDGGAADGGAADGGATDGGATDGGATDSGAEVVVDAGVGLRLPPVNGRLDYQLGGDYSPRAGVNVLSRDRLGTPAPGLYNICYVNGYQVQPGEVDDWDGDLILRDGGGSPIIDPDWDEAILDISSAEKRTRIAAVVGGWIERCGSDGFDAVEIDNLDTYSRTDGRIHEDDAVAFMSLLSARAHSVGLAIAQKNSAEILSRRAQMGTDFVVVEECARYRECEDFIDVYGELVLMIEYRTQDFERSCADLADTHAVVLRDLQLTTPASGRYVYDDC